MKKLILTHINRIANRIKASRKPDFIVGGEERPYLLRWWLLPRNPFFNVYLHEFRRSDDDRALHDHMYANASLLLDGWYIEHTIDQGGIHRETLRIVGNIVIRLSGKKAHRIEIVEGDYGQTPRHCTTLFVTGPRYREWGFHCPQRGWVHWKDFTDTRDHGSIGKGCGD